MVVLHRICHLSAKKVKSQRWMLTHHSRVGGLRKAHACEKGFSPESSRNRRLGFMALTHLTSARCWRSNRQKLCDAFFCSSIWFRSFLGSVQGPFSDQHCCTVDLGVQPWPGAVPEVCFAIQARFHQCYQIASNFSISWLWSSVFSHEVGNICNFWYEDSMRGCERIQYDLYIYIYTVSDFSSPKKICSLAMQYLLLHLGTHATPKGGGWAGGRLESWLFRGSSQTLSSQTPGASVNVQLLLG